MRIRFSSDGGFAPIAALQRPVEIDTASLPADERASLEALVRDARVLDLSGADLPPPSGSADVQTHTIEVDDGPRTSTVRVSDGAADPALRALVERLRAERSRAG